MQLVAGRLIWSRSVFKAQLAVTLLVCLTACSPRYNWRVMQGNDAFSVTFPAHVAHETRPIELVGARGSMTMHGAEVGHVTFAVGVANFDPSTDLSGAALQLDRDMARVLNSAPPPLTAVQIALQGTTGGVAGQAFEINSAGTHVYARVATRSGHLVEALVAGPPEAFNDTETSEARDTFFQSLTLY